MTDLGLSQTNIPKSGEQKQGRKTERVLILCFSALLFILQGYALCTLQMVQAEAFGVVNPNEHKNYI